MIKGSSPKPIPYYGIFVLKAGEEKEERDGAGKERGKKEERGRSKRTRKMVNKYFENGYF